MDEGNNNNMMLVYGRQCDKYRQISRHISQMSCHTVAVDQNMTI